MARSLDQVITTLPALRRQQIEQRGQQLIQKHLTMRALHSDGRNAGTDRGPVRLEGFRDLKADSN